MTNHEIYLPLKDRIAIMQAFSDGQTVQELFLDGWKDEPNPSWNWKDAIYRIKPSNEFRAWTFDEVPVGACIKLRDLDFRTIILSIERIEEEVRVVVGDVDTSLSLNDLLERYIQLNGAPCGCRA